MEVAKMGTKQKATRQSLAALQQKGVILLQSLANFMKPAGNTLQDNKLPNIPNKDVICTYVHNHLYTINNQNH